jgi:predicted transcriptional regulator
MLVGCGAGLLSGEGGLARGPKSAEPCAVYSAAFDKLPSVMKPALFILRSQSLELGPLEERVIEALWKLGSATGRELMENECPDYAITTLTTTLDRLCRKGVLKRVLKGRCYRYTCRITRQQFYERLAKVAVQRFLKTNPSSSLPISYLVDIVSKKGSDQLDELSRAIKEKQRKALGA